MMVEQDPQQQACITQGMRIRSDCRRDLRTNLHRASLLRSASLALCSLWACSLLSGCIVAGVSSSGGGFIWPGGLGLVVIVLVVLWMMRRR